MERYDSYKDSGVDWLGEIPAHWSTLRAKFVFREIDDRSVSGDEELLSVSHLTGVTPRSEKNITMFMAEDYTGAKLCHEGDLVINTMWAWMGALGVSPLEGIVSPAYGVYRQHRDGLLPKFADWLFRTPDYVAEYTRRSTGVNSSRLRLYPDQFLDLPVLVPPLEDQERIVAFLDQKTAEIDAAIAKKERLIELLQEQKSILINQAVTRGLNPDVPLRDSGIEWLGQIPAHWGIKKFKFCVKKVVGGATPFMGNQNYWNGEIPWVSPKDMGERRIVDSEMKVTLAGAKRANLEILPQKTFVFVARSGVLRNRIPTAITEIPVTLNQDVKGVFQDLISSDYMQFMFDGFQNDLLFR
ncbi:MAG: restriction endonuclease subunit S [Fibrobacteres bacterium]|nr:restriction endonuclease subunit S [Fibrobacterota bacterium]